jgi:hypothetical protein
VHLPARLRRVDCAPGALQLENLGFSSLEGTEENIRHAKRLRIFFTRSFRLSKSDREDTQHWLRRYTYSLGSGIFAFNAIPESDGILNKVLSLLNRSLVIPIIDWKYYNELRKLGGRKSNLITCFFQKPVKALLWPLLPGVYMI